jgi:hypothetical protein
MPLSPPAEREHIHTRTIECRGWRRADGLWDIEGHLTDVKSYGFDNFHRGRVEAGERLHEMWLRITIDETYLIHACEAATDHGPHGACGSVDADFSAMKGERVGPGILRIVREKFGGVRGCTHIVDLFGPVATTAVQTLGPIMARNKPRDPAKAPFHLNTCVALADDGDVVKREYSQFYTGS